MMIIGCDFHPRFLGYTQPDLSKLDLKNASVQQPLFMEPSPSPCHPERSRPVPPAPARRGACRRGICRSGDLPWKTECVTSHRVEARRAVTRHQPSPEGLGVRREADPSAVGAALFPLSESPVIDPLSLKSGESR
jgi:hypothetical protein